MKLNEKQLEVISRTVLEYLESEKQKEKKANRDRRLRNVKLLLKNYRSFANHSADVKIEINELNRKLELDELDTDEFAIESIKRSKERTLAMVKFINKMIEVYKIMCEQSGDLESLRRYQVVYEMYIGEPKKTAKEIAEGQTVHQRTIYKDINNACETLVVLMFGVDGVKFT